MKKRQRNRLIAVSLIFLSVISVILYYKNKYGDVGLTYSVPIIIVGVFLFAGLYRIYLWIFE